MVVARGSRRWQWRVSARANAMGAHRRRARRFNGSRVRGDYAEAFLLARQALDLVPDDPQLRQLWLNASIPAAMTTDPSGADVAFAVVPDARALVFPRPHAAQGRPRSAHDHPAAYFKGWISAD